MFDELKKGLRDELIGKRLHDLAYHSIIDEFFVFEEDHYGLVFGGLTLNFGDFNYSFGWNHHQLLNLFTKGDLKDLIGGEEHYEINKENFGFVAPLFNTQITDVNSEWASYRLLDEFEERTGEKKYGLQSLALEFEGGGYLQIASVDFDMGYDGAQNMKYKHNGYLLISANRNIFVLAKI